jgi:hypothetical protein
MATRSFYKCGVCGGPRDLGDHECDFNPCAVTYEYMADLFANQQEAMELAARRRRPRINTTTVNNTTTTTGNNNNNNNTSGNNTTGGNTTAH